MTDKITSVLVNPVTQMVALIARGGITNFKAGTIFGRPVAAAVKLLKEGRADLLAEKDLPALPKDKEYEKVKVNLQAGTVGDAKALSTTDMSGSKELDAAKARITELEAESAEKDKQIAELTKPAK